MKYKIVSSFMLVCVMSWALAQEQANGQDELQRRAAMQSIAAVKEAKAQEMQRQHSQKEERKQEADQKGIKTDDLAAVTDGGKHKGSVSLATLKLPDKLWSGYPIQIAIMDFTTGAELMVGSRNLPPALQALAKMFSAKKNKTMSIPLGATILGIELQKLNPQLFNVMPGKDGGGFEDLDALQEAILGLGVTHVIFCVLSDIHHAEDANSGVHYGGIEVSRTVYSLDLNVIVYDIPRKQTVLADTYTAEIAENRPFNEKNINRSMFETLLKDVCTIAARVIVENAEDKENPNGIKPHVNNK